MNEFALQGIIAACVIFGYIVLTIFGYDGNVLLSLLAGQALGGGAAAISQRKKR